MEHALVNYLSLDVPNTAFMLLCASLVMLMTPGLAFLWRTGTQKSIVTIMAQSFFSMGWVAALWFIVGYSLSFGPTLNGIIGDPIILS